MRGRYLIRDQDAVKAGVGVGCSSADGGFRLTNPRLIKSLLHSGAGLHVWAGSSEKYKTCKRSKLSLGILGNKHE